jgi:hypothetical protein
LTLIVKSRPVPLLRLNDYRDTRRANWEMPGVVGWPFLKGAPVDQFPSAETYRRGTPETPFIR